MAVKEIPLAPGTGRVVAWLSRQVECTLAESDLTPSQYRLLSLLEERPEVASALADKLTVSRPSVTNVVDGLVARGLVERSHDTHDRRRVTHALTREGRRVLHRADDVIEQRLRELVLGIDPAGARHLSVGLESLGVKLKERLAAWQQHEEQSQAGAR